MLTASETARALAAGGGQIPTGMTSTTSSMQQPPSGGSAGGDRILQVTFVNSQLADDPMEGIRAALAFDSLEARA